MSTTRRIKSEKIVSYLKKFSNHEINQIVEKIRAELKIPDWPDTRTVLNWDEIWEMAKNNIGFGAHTVSHNILTNLTEDKIMDEILISKRQIEDHLCSNVSGFCYPSNLYNDKIVQLVRQAGYQYAVCGKGFNFNEIDRYRIKRILIHEGITSNKAMFACWISGIFHYLKLIR